MNCADARHLIHLDAGGDLLSTEERSLAGHMEVCAECRAYSSGMVRAMDALQLLRDVGSRAAASTPLPAGGSAWLAVASRLPQRSRLPGSAGQRQTLRQFNLRVAALCACSLLLAVITIVQSLPVSQQPPSSQLSWSSPTAPWPSEVVRGPSLPVAAGPARISAVRHAPAGMPGTLLGLPPGSRFQIVYPDGSVAADFQVVPQPTQPASGVSQPEAGAY